MGKTVQHSFKQLRIRERNQLDPQGPVPHHRSQKDDQRCIIKQDRLSIPTALGAFGIPEG
eukprot:1414407-Amphidinium_carterae.1